MSPKLLSTYTSPMSISCIKRCPFDDQIVAIGYYQQKGGWDGGISVKGVSKNDYRQGSQSDRSESNSGFPQTENNCPLPPPSENYLQKSNNNPPFNSGPSLKLSPVMHLEWIPRKLRSNHMGIVVVTRQIELVIVEWNGRQQSQLTPLININLAPPATFLLYCDLYAPFNSSTVEIAVTTSQSIVYLVWLQLDTMTVADVKEMKVKGLEEGIWVCKYWNGNGQRRRLFVGDQLGGMTVVVDQEGGQTNHNNLIITNPTNTPCQSPTNQYQPFQITIHPTKYTPKSTIKLPNLPNGSTHSYWQSFDRLWVSSFDGGLASYDLRMGNKVVEGWKGDGVLWRIVEGIDGIEQIEGIDGIEGIREGTGKKEGKQQFPLIHSDKTPFLLLYSSSHTLSMVPHIDSPKPLWSSNGGDLNGKWPHQSLLYAGEWVKSSSNEQSVKGKHNRNNLFLLSSFYDNVVSLWQW